MAAWQELDQPSQHQANPRLPYCFDALAKVPAMVEASIREFGRPEWLVPINHRLLPQIHERFPQWFRADESGDNAMRLMARLIPSVPWESVLEGPIRTIASCASEELRALLGQSNAQGKTPLDELRERIQHCGGPTSPRAHALVQELESLADAVEIRSAAAVSVRRALAVRV